jgi:hypothetical protein
MTDLSHLKDQEARDAAPTVAPVEGWYALLRNGYLAHTGTNWKSQWHENGADIHGPFNGYDIIAVIPPDRLFAPDQSAEVSRLRGALRVASANITHVRIGLMSGDTKAMACNAIDGVHRSINEALKGNTDVL